MLALSWWYVYYSKNKRTRLKVIIYLNRLNERIENKSNRTWLEETNISPEFRISSPEIKNYLYFFVVNLDKRKFIPTEILLLKFYSSLVKANLLLVIWASEVWCWYYKFGAILIKIYKNTENSFAKFCTVQNVFARLESQRQNYSNAKPYRN